MLQASLFECPIFLRSDTISEITFKLLSNEWRMQILGNAWVFGIPTRFNELGARWWNIVKVKL